MRRPARLTGATSGCATGAARSGRDAGLADPLRASVAAELTRLRPREIVILGSAPTVSQAVQVQAENYAPVVRRIAGSDRYRTASLISAEFPASDAAPYIAIVVVSDWVARSVTAPIPVKAAERLGVPLDLLDRLALELPPRLSASRAALLSL